MVDGRWLVAASRSAHGEANGRLYGLDGKLSGAIALGDGISHIRCAPDGTIWVGHFDEGICSVLNTDGGWPISTGGIVRFAPDGIALWSLNTDNQRDLFIIDCYALTLNANTPWACCYPEFPIIRVKADVIRQWSNPCKGARALAVEGECILLAGGYDAASERIALLRLGESEACQIGELKLQRLRTADHVQGQGGELHIVGDNRWTRVNVADVRAIIGA